MNYCTNCGAPLPENGKFCSNCGMQAQAEASASVSGTAPTPAAYPVGLSRPDKTPAPAETPAERIMKRLSAPASLVLAVIAMFCESNFLVYVCSAAAIAAGVLAFRKKARYRVLAVPGILLAAACIAVTAFFAPSGAPAPQPVNQSYTQSPAAPTFTPPPTLPIPGTTPKPAAQSSGVDPELKAFLSSYESFIDEYVDFMQDYSSDSSNITAMMNDYLSMTMKLNELSAQADRYDAGTMSDADAAYYLEVMARCETKLLQAIE